MNIPEETQKRFPDLVEMTLKSGSMNDEERQYWLNVLPEMDEKQIAEFRDILQTEKLGMEKINSKFTKTK